MTIKEFEKRHGVYLRNKSSCWWAKAIAYFFPSFNVFWWTTIRFPFCAGVIAYPDGICPTAPRFTRVLEHELVHVEQQRSAWGLFVSVLLCFFLPLPALFSGRWFIERPAYLQDIVKWGLSVEVAVDRLWRSYLWVWPKPLMRKWFYKQIRSMTDQQKCDTV